MNDLAQLFENITLAQQPGAWTKLDKNQGLAAVIIALRPKIVVEIGVWEGGSMIPMLLALKHLGEGVGIAIDPWSAAASIEGQVDQANIDWWSNQRPHDMAYNKFVGRMQTLGLTNICKVLRKRSDEIRALDLFEARESIMESAIGLLHVDGNHSDAAISDVKRFAPYMPVGGVLVLDDVNWSGGAVQKAKQHAIEIGFRQMYELGSHGGCFMQRMR